MIALAETFRILKVQENIGHGVHAMIKRKQNHTISNNIMVSQAHNI